MATKIAHTATNLSKSFKDANFSHKQQPIKDKINWIAPTLGHYKLNVDAGFNENDKVSMSGTVIRGHNGEIIISARKQHTYTFSALHAELNAILFGLHIANSEDIKVQFVELDSKLAMSEIKKGSTSASNWLNVILDIDYYSALCGIHSFSFIPREANELAHQIAKTHGLLSNTNVWHFNFP